MYIPAEELTKEQAARIQKLRDIAEQYAKAVRDLVPAGSDRDDIFRRLLTVRFWTIHTVLFDSFGDRRPTTCGACGTSDARIYVCACSRARCEHCWHTLHTCEAELPKN